MHGALEIMMRFYLIVVLHFVENIIYSKQYNDLILCLTLKLTAGCML